MTKTTKTTKTKTTLTCDASPFTSVNLTCGTCNKPHTATRQEVAEWGHEMDCMKCIDWAHIDWMRTTGKKLGMSCVKNCRCGAGV